VVNQRQARELLVAVTYVGRRGKDLRGERLRAFFACMYLAALRPSEALGLRADECFLPDSGWGALTLTTSRPTAGKRYTDSGEVHDLRGLKHRAATEPRRVPVPPPLVTILREHIDRFGIAEDGRLFRSDRGRPVGASTYSTVWQEARRLALPPTKAASPWLLDPTTFGTRRCLCGSMPASPPPRLPAVPVTPSTYCSSGTRSASTARPRPLTFASIASSTGSTGPHDHIQADVPDLAGGSWCDQPRRPQGHSAHVP
jgi:hypothetical protein